MPTNVYFDHGNQNEQRLYEELIIEQLSIYGQDVYYLPRTLVNEDQILGEDTSERRQAFLSTIPIGRFSTPKDLGNAACYLCSDEASMITGAILEVDGGRCI